MDRKQFLKRSFFAGLGCCGAALGLGREPGRGEGQAVTLTADLTRRIREGAKSPDWRKMEEAVMKFKAMMGHLDEMLDEETKKRLLNACGRSCFINAFGVADERKPTRERAEAYLQSLEKAGFEVRRERDTVTVMFGWGTKQNPYGLSMQEGFCMCPIVETGVPGMSKSYCQCSAGYVKEAFERGTGMAALNVEVLESILQGGRDCRFKVVLKA